MKGWFVTGTDTGVGKTLVACALVRAMRARDLDVGVMKPVETGVGPEGPLDAQALRAAAGVADPLDDVCPQRFALAAAPSVAAAAEGRSVDLAAVRAAFARLAARHAWLVVEGAGGLLVPVAAGCSKAGGRAAEARRRRAVRAGGLCPPITRKVGRRAKSSSMADLARSFELPLVVVARAALGTINHTLLTLEAAAARGLSVAGVVISHSGGPPSAADAANLGALREALGTGLLGELPPLPPGQPPPQGALDLDALLGR